MIKTSYISFSERNKEFDSKFPSCYVKFNDIPERQVVTLDELEAHAASEIVRKELNEKDQALTIAVQRVLPKLTPMYPVQRLYTKVRKSKQNAPFLPIPGKSKYALFNDHETQDFIKGCITDLVDQDPDNYDECALMIANPAFTLPYSNAMHHDGFMYKEEFFHDDLIKSIRRNLLTKWFAKSLDEPISSKHMPPINKDKGIGFYTIHPDGSPIELSDLYAPVPDKLWPVVNKLKVQYDNFNFYARKDNKLLKFQWQTSDKIRDITEYFLSSDYANPDEYVKGVLLGAASVQVAGERNNQVDVPKNKTTLFNDGFDKWVQTAYAKNRIISYVSKQNGRFLNNTFAVNDEWFQPEQRKRANLLGIKTRNRPVYGAPSTTIGPGLIGLNKYLFHEIETSEFGLPSTQQCFIDRVNKWLDFARQNGYQVAFLDVDNSNSETKVSDSAHKLREMLPECFRQIHDNATTVTMESLSGAIALYLVLASGGPFTTSDNMIYGINTVFELFRSAFSIKRIEPYVDHFFDIIVNKTDEVIDFSNDAGYPLLYIPWLGTDNQIAMLLTRDLSALKRDCSKIQKMMEDNKIEGGLVLSASEFGVKFNSYKCEPDTKVGRGKIPKIERPCAGFIAAFKFYMRCMNGGDWTPVIDKHLRRCFGVSVEDYKSSVDVYKDYLSLYGLNPDTLSPLSYNAYSPSDLKTVGRYLKISDDDARELLEGEKYPVDVLGPVVDMYISSIRSKYIEEVKKYA